MKLKFLEMSYSGLPNNSGRPAQLCLDRYRQAGQGMEFCAACENRERAHVAGFQSVRSFFGVAQGKVIEDIEKRKMEGWKV